MMFPKSKKPLQKAPLKDLCNGPLKEPIKDPSKDLIKEPFLNAVPGSLCILTEPSALLAQRCVILSDFRALQSCSRCAKGGHAGFGFGALGFRIRAYRDLIGFRASGVVSTRH